MSVQLLRWCFCVICVIVSVSGLVIRCPNGLKLTEPQSKDCGKFILNVLPLACMGVPPSDFGSHVGHGRRVHEGVKSLTCACCENQCSLWEMIEYCWLLETIQVQKLLH